MYNPNNKKISASIYLWGYYYLVTLNIALRCIV